MLIFQFSYKFLRPKKSRWKKFFKRQYWSVNEEMFGFYQNRGFTTVFWTAC